jgi:hypothetical protein
MIDRDNQIGRQLKEEAEQENTAFSSVLHDRVMAGVRRERVMQAPLHGWRIWCSLGAVAAAVAVVIGLWVTRQQPQITPLPVQVIELPEIRSPGRMVSEAIRPARQKLNDARFAYLDRDGKRLAHFLWHSMPGVPVE